MLNANISHDAFRDFAAEKLVARAELRIYAESVAASRSDCGEDCHAITVVDAAGESHEIGEVLDSLTSAEMNAEIARRIDAAGI